MSMETKVEPKKVEPSMIMTRPWGPAPDGRAAAEEQLPSEQGRLELWIDELRRGVKNCHPRFNPTSQPTIFRAPASIIEADRAAYEPSAVSIGPLHSRCDELQNFKWHFLRCVLSRCGKDASRILAEWLTDLKARDMDVRGCYSTDLRSLDPYQLAFVMLLDGCFIIYLMLSRREEGHTVSVVTSPHPSEPPNITGESIAEIVDNMVQERKRKGKEKEQGMHTDVPKLDLGTGPGSGSVVDMEIGGIENFGGVSLLGHLWIRNLIVYDLLKLGNQIPFFVIRMIFDKLSKTTSNDGGNVDKLTDLALNLFSDIHPNKSTRFPTTHPNEIHHLLHLFHSSIVTHRQASRPAVAATKHGASTTPKRIPNATDLAMAGVKFKRKEEFDSFLDVSFKDGILEIPPLQIFNYSKSLFRNLIAFEQCYPVKNTDITIYANFMDCIIDTANDVRLLHLKGIFFNGLSTDDEVAGLFNQLCNQIHFDPKKNYLNDLFIEVTKYHESKWHQWRAGLVRDYFSNPWAIISTFAAMLLLLLTIDQCFFAALAYFRPP